MDEKRDFEAIYKELEKITTELSQTSDLSLNDAIAKYKKGSILVKELEKLLEDAKKIIESEKEE